MSSHGAQVRFIGAVAGRPDLVEQLFGELAARDLRAVPARTGAQDAWRIAVPTAHDAESARAAVSAALRDAGVAVGTCLAVSVSGY